MQFNYKLINIYKQNIAATQTFYVHYSHLQQTKNAIFFVKNVTDKNNKRSIDKIKNCKTKTEAAPVTAVAILI